MQDGSIVFRTYSVTFTEEDLRTGIAHAEYQVVVEVDQVDPEAHEGWVVLVRGTAHHVDTARPASTRSSVLTPRPARTGTPEPGPAAQPARTVPRSARAPHPAPPQQCLPPCTTSSTMIMQLPLQY
jgi:hypothetical protein